MKLDMSQCECQLPNLPSIQSDKPIFNKWSLRLTVRRLLGAKLSRKVENFRNNALNLRTKLQGNPGRPLVDINTLSTESFEAGDLVRVRSINFIETTLNHSWRLKGCSFAPEMKQYCGTIQKVLKPVKRFVDERDLRVRNARGIVLLEGITCQGTTSFGPCDRCCYFFWRVEWLEKLDKSTID